MQLDRLLDGLPPKARSAFLLSQLDGLTYPEIAQRLGVSLSSVQHDAARGMPPDPVVRQAIAWWAKLQSGLADAHDRESCQAWLEAAAAHRRAWDRLQAIGRDARRVPPALAHAALNAPRSPGRRAALRGLLAFTGLAATGWAGYRHTPWQRLAADLSTSVGERRTVALAEGLNITLNSDSARAPVSARCA
ncbi:hypothetical protein G6F68_012863 [Rhizopus microsporus]|nr:hypothetical protein G6F68_012863 [Rhizopus microsporus]